MTDHILDARPSAAITTLFVAISRTDARTGARLSSS